MAQYDTFHKCAEELERSLRLRAFPLAVKLLKGKEDIPERALRPKRDLGYHLSLCQAFARARTIGTSTYGTPKEGAPPSSPAMVMLKEDMWCPEPVIGYGLAEPPRYFLDGHTRYPGTHRTLEAGATWAQAFPRLEVGKCIGVVASPLAATNFRPDVIVIYCDSAQLSLLITAATWKTGETDLLSKLHPSGACVRAIVPVILEGKFQVSLPCWGDRTRAMAQDFELIFSLPGDKLEDLMEGLASSAKTGRKMPVQRSMWPEHEMPDSYVTLARLMGTEV